MKRLALVVAAAALGGLTASAWAQTPGTGGAQRPLPATLEWERMTLEFGGTPAATKPSRDAQMSFPSSTEIQEIPIKGGQRVKKGDLLVRARDAEIRTAIDQQRALAENEWEIQGAEAQKELADIRYKNLVDSQVFSPEEFDQRRIEAKTAAVQLEQAKFNKQQQVLRLAQLEAQYERYRLVAPFDGIIDEITADVGQGVTEQDKVLRIVNIDELWLDPTPPTALTLELDLKPGSKAWVLIDLPGRPQLVEGKVIEVSAVADSVSLTRRVRVEIENPKGWPAGTQAVVRFAKPEGERWVGMYEESKETGMNEKEAARVIAEMQAWGQVQLSQADEIRAVVAELLADPANTLLKATDKASEDLFKTRSAVPAPKGGEVLAMARVQSTWAASVAAASLEREFVPIPLPGSLIEPPQPDRRWRSPYGWMPPDIIGEMASDMHK